MDANRIQRARGENGARVTVDGGGGHGLDAGQPRPPVTPQQFANAMTAVRSCFAAAVLLLVITCGPYHSDAAFADTTTANATTAAIANATTANTTIANATTANATTTTTATATTDTANAITANAINANATTVKATTVKATTEVLFSACCVGPYDGNATCRIGNRTFHRVETIGGGSCANWSAADAASVRKCCAPEWTYDPEIRFCRPPAAAGPHGDAADSAFRRMLLQRLYRLAPDDNGTTTVVGYDYEPPKCGATEVLVDLAADEVELLPRDGWPPPGYCFDLPWSANDGRQQRLVARTCRARDQYCNGGGYTCANKCCRGDRMIGEK